MIREWIAALLLLSGALFMLFAAIGLLRFPDLYARMHAASKGSSFAVAQMLLAVAVHFGELLTLLETLVIILFIFLTIPVSAHMIARAGYLSKVPMYRETVVDELAGKYDLENQRLEGRSPSSGKEG